MWLNMFAAATNHLGHFLLVNMLLRSVLVDSVQGKEAPLLRIVSVASGTHDPAKKTGMPHPRYIKADWLAHPERDTEDTKKDGRCTYTYIHHYPQPPHTRTAHD
jgi:hypothetical protein